MASNAPTECGICKETFTEEERCPRILPCFHCLCSQCIDQLIQTNSKCCPFCRQNFKANSSQEFGVNRSLIELLKYVAKLDSTSKSPHGGKTKQLAMMMTEFGEENKKTNKENLAQCQGALTQIENAIKINSKLTADLLQTNKKIDEEILTKFQEIKTKNATHIKYLGEENNRLKSHLKEISARQKQMKNVDAELKAASDFTAGARIVEKAEETNIIIQKSLQGSKDILKRNEKTQLSIGKVTKKTYRKITIIQEVLASGDKEEEDKIDLTPGMGAMAIQEVATNDPRVIKIRYLSGLLKNEAPDRSVFAAQDLQGKGRRYARITINEKDQLFLHHLKQEQYPPINAQVYKYDDIRSLVDISCRWTFLELGVGGRSLGKLLIRLSNVGNAALNYFLLCTGEMGPSYANSNVIDIQYKGDVTSEWVRMGDYETNNGKGGKALVTGVDWTKEWQSESREWPWLKGTVCGNYDMEASVSQFVILTKDYPNYGPVSGSFGMVEEGLSVLAKAISKYPDGKAIKIIDCGVVLSR